MPNKNMSALNPPLRAVKMGLFPTMGSLQEVVDLADSKLPISSRNELVAILMTYHNTLIQQIPAP
jgi:hypothetical protein